MAQRRRSGRDDDGVERVKLVRRGCATKFDDEGFYKSTTGQKLGGGDGMGGSFTLKWEPNDS